MRDAIDATRNPGQLELELYPQDSLFPEDMDFGDWCKAVSIHTPSGFTREQWTRVAREDREATVAIYGEERVQELERNADANRP